ncbi:MAG: helix-turn-helix domain-containing protein, partial [Candidatus Promineifilaceae bacterium]|nr:helix-turn-helix domain-containing protein [Candidatus Promineifilaceae bacterium]
FTMSEQQLLQKLTGLQGNPAAEQAQTAFTRLEAQGIICRSEGGWRIRSPLLAQYVDAATPASPGGLWLDEQADLIFQGDMPVENLAPLESALLRYLLGHPYTRHTHTELIEATWPEDTLREGVSTEALYQVVRGLRRKVEPAPSRPRYVVNWRGTPEGGYRCFPEGNPL